MNMAAIGGTNKMEPPYTKMVKRKFISIGGGRIREDIYLICPYIILQKTVDLLTIPDNTRRTHLREACKHGNYRVVDTFMSNGRIIELFHIDGSTPLLVKGEKFGDIMSPNVCEDGEISMVATLQKCYKTPALHMASKGNNKVAVCLLLRMGAKVGVKNHLGMTALHYASTTCAQDVIDILLDNGEDVNAKDCHGDTPLHLVASNPPLKNIPAGFILQTVGKMLSRGASILEKNDNLQTPYETLHLVISKYGRLDTPLFEDNDEIMLIEELFIAHITKLQELKPQAKLNTEWKLGQDFYNYIKLDCLQELNYMKSTTIVKDISLYQVLFRKMAYRISFEDLKHIDEFISSRKLFQKCPIYTLSLRTTFQRSKLLTLAVESFYTERRKQMMKEIPCEVTEQLMTYLTNEDLKNFIRSE